MKMNDDLHGRAGGGAVVFAAFYQASKVSMLQQWVPTTTLLLGALVACTVHKN